MPRLEPIQVRPSVKIWRVQLALHSLLALLLLWAFLPWLTVAWYWPVLLFFSLSGLFASIFYLRSKLQDAAGFLGVMETGWYWRDKSGGYDLLLNGELVVWPGLIVLPFKERSSRRRKTLVLVSDSCAAEDLRRLRVWLRTVLPRLGARD